MHNATAWKAWNPITGCTKISEGCLHCYAERMAGRADGAEVTLTVEGESTLVYGFPRIVDELVAKYTALADEVFDSVYGRFN